MANIQELESLWMTAISFRDTYIGNNNDYKNRNLDKMQDFENGIGTQQELDGYQKYLDMCDVVTELNKKITLINQQRLDAVLTFS